MKKIILILILLGIFTFAKAQNSVGYSYDANGNRVQRYFVGLRPINLNFLNTADSIKAVEENKLLAEEKGIKVYPNPTLDRIYIVINKPGNNPDELGKTEILILDNSGKTLGQLKYSGNETSFDMSAYPPGNYNVKIVFSDKKTINYKVLKVN
jgi:hypothetical protein